MGDLSVKRSLALALCLTFAFMTVEAIGGWLAGSLAMLGAKHAQSSLPKQRSTGDAAHMMTDAASFAVSLSAVYLAEHGATDKMTFGHGRVEVLAALWSTLSIWLLTGLLVGEAIRRIKLYVDGNAENINGAMMSLLGALGVLINVVLERVLGRNEVGGHSHSHSHCSAGHSHGHSHTAQGNAHKSQELVACLQDEEVGHSHAESEGKEHHADSHCHEHEHDHSHMEEHSHAHGHNLLSGESRAPKHTEKSKLGRSSNGTYSAVATSEDHQLDAHDAHAFLPPQKSANLNLDAAHLHVLGDLLQSLGVVVAGLVIWLKPNLQIADPICTLIFAVFVLVTTVSMLQRTIVLLLQGAPEYVAVDSLRTNLIKIEAVVDVHDLHVWELTPGRSILSVHIGVDPLSHRTIDDVLSEAHKISQDAGIEYATIQVQKTLGDQCAAAIWTLMESRPPGFALAICWHWALGLFPSALTAVLAMHRLWAAF